jgi:hypothetical protein
MTQPVLFDRPTRLTRQCAAMLDRLRHGRVSNAELAQVALKYTSRISDLRAAGYDVQCVKQDKATGLSWYELVVG